MEISSDSHQGAFARSKLPAEIVDHIIDDLALYVPALRACSLTCSEWRVRSQYHLLSSVYIADATHIAALSVFVAMSPFKAEGILRVRIDISALSGDAVLQLRPLVKTDNLTLSGSNSNFHKEVRLARLLAIFPNISSFTITGCPLGLNLNYFMRMLSGFALLRTVDLHRGPTVSRSGYPVADDDVPADKIPLSLENLALNVDHKHLCLCFTARSLFDVTALHRLDLDVPGRAMIRNGYLDLLVQALPTLHDLVLRVELADSPILQMDTSIFPPAPNLKTLHVSLGQHNLDPRELAPILHLACALAYPAYTAVTVESLVASPHMCSQWEHGWSVVAQELAREPVRCSSLTLAVPKLIAEEHQTAFAKIEQMLRACDVTIRALL